jgi:pimeloyl-ACP methyl ester carboxylesterase
MSLQTLPVIEHGEQGPLIVALHWLGGSAQTWNEVGSLLATRGYRFVALDLPGFGHAISNLEFAVETMATQVMATVRELRRQSPGAWLLVGHSMGGKLAAIVTRAAQDNTEGLDNLTGVVLISPSPVGPEPMEESKRAEMLKSLARATTDATENETRARKFVEDNIGKLPLVESVQHRSIDDVLRMNRDAFVAWLTSGSKEDWADRVGVIDVPALVLAGTEEKALGPKAQRTHTLAHFRNATLSPLEGGGHLGPLERPFEIVEHIAEFAERLGVLGQACPAKLGAKYRALIESDATSPQTRRVLEKRMLHECIPQDDVFTKDETRVLRRLIELVIPDAGFDLSTRLQDGLLQEKRDGWRFDALPTDVEAWQLGMCSLGTAADREFGVPFIALDTERQDDLLERARRGELGKGFFASIGVGRGRKCLDARQMRDWFEDVRGELVRIYVSDPRAMERIGFTGFADEHGFTQIKLGEREVFEF